MVSRSEFQMLRDVLVVIRNYVPPRTLRGTVPIKPTHILYKANLTTSRLNSALKSLVDNGLIEGFVVTDRGSRFIDSVYAVESYIKRR